MAFLYKSQLVLLIVALLISSIGFKKFVWFLSVGYGLSAAGLGLALLIYSLFVVKQYSFIYIVFCLLLLVYGIRLGGFLLLRELKNEKYQKKMDSIGANVKTPIFVSIVVWLLCGALYVCQAGSLEYILFNGLAEKPAVSVYIGAFISLIGIILEAVADKQKSAQKDKNPNMPATEGLFKLCRCPNYFGEILFWTGIFVASFGAVSGAQWIVVIIGYIGIVGVMFSGAKRLETRHIKNYGSMPEYHEYADKTPILIPFIPWYHIIKDNNSLKK